MENIEKKELGNLAKAVISVMKDEKVHAMEKTSRIGTGDSAYDGTKDSDVKEVFNKVLAENGLCILPIGIKESTKINRWEETNNYGTKTKQSVFTKVTTKYLLLHTSGESIELAGYGHGIDPQDKGAGKSTTYALKNCLLYTFLTPVNKIDDTDQTHSKDIPTPQNAKKQPQQKKEKVLPELIKDSDQWNMLMKFFEEGKVNKMDQITREFKVNKNLLKILQVMVDNSVNAKILEEKLAEESGKATETLVYDENVGNVDNTDDQQELFIESTKETSITKPAETEKIEKTTVVRLPALDNDTFEKAKKGTKTEILKVLAGHRMAKNQREELEELANKL